MEGFWTGLERGEQAHPPPGKGSPGDLGIRLNGATAKRVAALKQVGRFIEQSGQGDGRSAARGLQGQTGNAAGKGHKQSRAKKPRGPEPTPPSEAARSQGAV